MKLLCQSCSSGPDAVLTPVSVADLGQARRTVWWSYIGAGLAGQASVGIRHAPLLLALFRARTPLSLARARAKQSIAPPHHRHCSVVPACYHHSSTTQFLAPIAPPPPPLPPRTITTSRRSLVRPHFASPPPRCHQSAAALTAHRGPAIPLPACLHILWSSTPLES